MTFRLEGFEDLEKALSEVAKQSTRVAITRRALRKAAAPMLEKAVRYAPVDSGKLEDSIKISTRATGEVGRAAYAATMRATGGDKAASVAAMRTARREFKAMNPPAILYLGPTQDAWYAKFVEFGTKSRTNGGRFAGSKHPGTAPDPFLRPAFDSEAQATIDRLAPLIWDEIQKHAARMQRFHSTWDRIDRALAG